MIRARQVVHALVAALLAGTMMSPAHAQKGMDELLKQIQQGSKESQKINQEREQRFLKNRDQQAALLQRAEADLASAEARAKQAK
ncbi:MAG TPA: hypothetical protein VJM11_11335 [Nevskiaceae bacterium]|nr:hypothetical protein [Nevskiaceae bacterium]